MKRAAYNPADRVFVVRHELSGFVYLRVGRSYEEIVERLGYPAGELRLVQEREQRRHR